MRHHHATHLHPLRPSVPNSSRVIQVVDWAYERISRLPRSKRIPLTYLLTLIILAPPIATVIKMELLAEQLHQRSH